MSGDAASAGLYDEEALECPLLRVRGFSSIRSKTLRRFLTVWYHTNFSPSQSKLRKRVRERDAIKGGTLNSREDIVLGMKPEDIMSVLPVKKRTAIDYIETLKVLTIFDSGAT